MGASTLLLTACGSNVSAEPPTETPVTTPSPEATMTPEQIIKSLELPATLTPEQLGETLVNDRISDWYMYGATAENRNGYYDADGEFSYIQELADKNGELFADALFVSNWRELVPPQGQKLSLADYVTGFKMANADALENWFKTSDSGDPDDIEPFVRSLKAGHVSIISDSGNEITMTIDTTAINNADKNRIKDLDPSNLTGNGNKFVIFVKFVRVGDLQKISELHWN